MSFSVIVVDPKLAATSRERSYNDELGVAMCALFSLVPSLEKKVVQSLICNDIYIRQTAKRHRAKGVPCLEMIVSYRSSTAHCKSS